MVILVVPIGPGLFFPKSLRLQTLNFSTVFGGSNGMRSSSWSWLQGGPKKQIYKLDYKPYKQPKINWFHWGEKKAYL